MKFRTGALLVALSAFTAGCAGGPDAGIATRNVQTNFDLQSVVRGQSNELLALSQTLEEFAQAEFVSLRRFDRELTKAVAQMDQVDMNLPSLLAMQDVELAELSQLIADGLAEDSDHSRRAGEIQTYRRALLASLKASGSRVTLTANALRAHEFLTAQRDLAEDLTRDLNAAQVMIEMQL